MYFSFVKSYLLLVVLNGQKVGHVAVNVSVPLSLHKVNQPVAILSAVSLLKHSVSQHSDSHGKERVQPSGLVRVRSHVRSMRCVAVWDSVIGHVSQIQGVLLFVLVDTAQQLDLIRLTIDVTWSSSRPRDPGQRAAWPT